MDNFIVRLKNVTKNFGPLEILKNIDVDMRRGDSLAVVGPSGAGKSTLLHIAGLMEKPSGGLIEIEGQNAGNLRESEKARLRLEKIGFLFQFHHLLPDFNVLENTLIPVRLAKDDLSKGKKEGLEILERLGLKDRLHHHPSQLSGGEQQRTALARALIRKPPILLCDEPTGNLDPHTGENVMSLIWNEIAKNKLTTIIVTHNPTISAFPQRCFELKEGHLKNNTEATP